jgi:uncharacterized membrane protein
MPMLAHALIGMVDIISNTPANGSQLTLVDIPYCVNSPDVCSSRPDFGPVASPHGQVLDYGDNLIDPLNLSLILLFFFVLAIFMLHWAVSSKVLPADGRARTSSEVGVDALGCRFGSWRGFIKLIIAFLCIAIGVAAVSTAFVSSRIPNDTTDPQGKHDIADSYVQTWVIAVVATLGGIAVLVLLIRYLPSLVSNDRSMMMELKQ